MLKLLNDFQQELDKNELDWTRIKKLNKFFENIENIDWKAC
jgi:hypothetical protein